MVNFGKHIAYVLAFMLLVNGCTERAIDENKPVIPESNNEKIVIQKLEKTGSHLQLSTNPDFSIYQNSTLQDGKIGDYIESDISEFAPAGYNGKLSQNALSEINQVSISKPTIQKTEWLLRLVFDNDIFSNTDYYYTHGTTIDLVIPIMIQSPLNKIFFAPKDSDLEFCGFSITQNIYTPTNPDTENILYGDRPFSSYLTIGQFREVYNLNKNIYVKSQLNLGVLGPSSFGGDVQSSIHEITPVGWQNQISNSFVIDYSFQVKKGIVNKSFIDLNLTGKANIGTLYDKAGGGFDFRIGHFTPFYTGPFSVFEKDSPKNQIQYWFFVNSSVNFIGYDATLQGGMFKNESPYTIGSGDINRVVFEASAGIAFYYNNVGIEYEHFYLSPEFNGGRHFGWGRITAVLSF